MNPTMTIETITPEIAQAWLSQNMKNRTMRMHRVKQYAEEMRRGQWQLAGDPIRFDHNGILLDGQHRLRAVVEYGNPMPFVIIRGLDSDSFKVMDKGMNRGPGDALGHNIPAATHKAAAIRLIYAYLAGGDPRKTDDRNCVTRTDIANFYDHSASLIDEVTLSGSSVYRAVGGNRSAWIAFLYIIHGSPNHRQFVDAMTTGSGLAVGSPILSLRNWLAQKGNQRVTNSGDHLALYIKSWNDWSKHKSRSIMRLPNPSDQFPVAIGGIK